MPFFRWDENLLDVLLDGNQRTSLNVVVSAVLDKMLDGFTSPRETLHFVKDDDRLAAVKRYAVFRAEDYEESVQVVQVILKGVEYGGTHVIEIDEDVGLVLRLGELFHDGGLANTSSPFHEQGFGSFGRLLPFKQFGVYLSFENHAAKISIFDNAQV